MHTVTLELENHFTHTVTYQVTDNHKDVILRVTLAPGDTFSFQTGYMPIHVEQL